MLYSKLIFVFGYFKVKLNFDSNAFIYQIGRAKNRQKSLAQSPNFKSRLYLFHFIAWALESSSEREEATI